MPFAISPSAAGEPRFHDLLMRVGHWSKYLRYIINFGMMVVLLLPISSGWQDAALFCYIGFAILHLTIGLYHDRRLCERCIRQMPLDITEQAAKHHRVLWMAHRPRVILAIMYADTAACFLLGSLSLDGYVKFPLASAYGLFLAYAYIMATHNRFRPWCPWCHPRGGGGHCQPDPEPDPVITPPRDRTLV